MFLVRVDDSVPGLLLRVASYRSVRDEILLTDDWVAVRKVVNDDGEGITLIFDYNFDGTIDAVQFSHEKSPITNLREAGNMSKEEKTKLQSYFNGVMASAYFLKILKDETEKNRPAR